MAVLKSECSDGDPEQGFRPCYADVLNQKLSSVCGAGYAVNTCCRKSFSHSTPSLMYNDECLPRL